MKVAIIGAGVSGIACAHELERYGVKPVIFERNSFIGEQFSHVASLLEVTHRPIRDALRLIHKKYDIDIKPLNTINTLVHNAPQKTSTIKGNLGYFIFRGRENNDLKKQIFSQLKGTEVRFNENVYYDALEGMYDHIVISSGEPSMTDELGCWQEWFQGYERGAVVLGNFDPNTQIMWVNKNYCKKGYAYLAPYNKNKAFITLVVSDVDEKEIDAYWEEFLYTENIKYTIIEEFKLEHLAGYAYPNKVNNIYFIGNAGGALDSFLGFGQVNAIVTGIMAARSICTGEDYEKLIKPITRRTKQFYEFRKAFNNLTNDNYDTLIRSIGLSGVKQILYQSSLNIPKYGAKFLRINKKKR